MYHHHHPGSDNEPSTPKRLTHDNLVTQGQDMLTCDSTDRQTSCEHSLLTLRVQHPGNVQILLCNIKCCIQVLQRVILHKDHTHMLDMGEAVNVDNLLL